MELGLTTSLGLTALGLIPIIIYFFIVRRVDWKLQLALNNDKLQWLNFKPFNCSKCNTTWLLLGGYLFYNLLIPNPILITVSVVIIILNILTFYFK
jgi:amino acid transporter